MSKRPLWISIALFVAACASPALMMRINHARYESINGIQLLFSGLVFGWWMKGNFAALANIPLWFSWILFATKRYAAARTCGIIALVLSLATFQLLVQAFWFDEAAAKVGYLAWPHVGYFCWIGSMLCIFFNADYSQTTTESVSTHRTGFSAAGTSGPRPHKPPAQS